MRRKRRRSGAYCGGAGMPLGFPCERGSSAAAITGRRRVRHAWGGGMMRLRSVWMGAGSSGVFSLRCRIGRSAKAMRRCALRRFRPLSADCIRSGADRLFAGLCLVDKSIAEWRGRSVRTRNRAGVGAKRSLSGEVPDSLCSALAAMRFGAGIRFRCAGAVRPSRRAAPASGYWFFFCFSSPEN